MATAANGTELCRCRTTTPTRCLQCPSTQATTLCRCPPWYSGFGNVGKSSRLKVHLKPPTPSPPQLCQLCPTSRFTMEPCTQICWALDPIAYNAGLVCANVQLMRTGRFRLYDYGSPEDNKAHYGTSKPPDIAQHYHLLQDLPIDLVAGRQDGIIPPEDVLLHYKAMEQAGVQVQSCCCCDAAEGLQDVIFTEDERKHHINGSSIWFFFLLIKACDMPARQACPTGNGICNTCFWF